MAHLGIPGVTEWFWDEGDPEEIFFLEEEIAGTTSDTLSLNSSSRLIWNGVQGDTQCDW